MTWEVLSDLRHRLVYKPHSVYIKTDFFDINEIEFDVNPPDLNQSIQNFTDLLEFMQLIAGATSKPCHLTYENRHDHLALTWDPIARCFTLGPYASGWPNT